MQILYIILGILSMVVLGVFVLFFYAIIFYMEINKEQIHGFWVRFEQDLREGITYLSEDLQTEEAKTIFDAARLTGRAEFEDDEDRDWTLTYIRDDDIYVLTLREQE